MQDVGDLAIVGIGEAEERARRDVPARVAELVGGGVDAIGADCNLIIAYFRV